MPNVVRQRRIDCNACGGVQTMTEQKVSKMSQPVQIIGWIIAIPSILGVIGAVLFFVVGTLGIGASAGAGGADADAQAAATGVAFLLTGGSSLCVGMSALVSGLIGYLLIMKKKVWKCGNCGFHIDRD